MSEKKFEVFRKHNYTTGCTTLRFSPAWKQEDISFNDAEIKELFIALTDVLPVGLIEKWSDETWSKRMILRHEEMLANLDIGQKALDTMMQKRGGDIESLKGLFDRHYGTVACGQQKCLKYNEISTLRSDVKALYSDLKKMREKLLEASR